MPRGKWINKKTAQHFTLVHRPQNDPLIHDEDAPSMVLNPTSAPNAGKGKKMDDLRSELGSETSEMRDNEGEAAEYGVYFDDTEYDYMQHLRDLGSGSGGDVVFVEAEATKNKDKGKAKQKSLEQALRQLDIQSEEDKKRELLDEEILPSKNLTRLTYQNQQDVPDAIGGFQPDMDPRVREALEALEDEAFVVGDEGEDDDDFLNELTKDGQELDEEEFEHEGGDGFDDEDGWESDDTAKPASEYPSAAAIAPGTIDLDEAPDLVPTSNEVNGMPGAGEAADQPGWLDQFAQYKQDLKSSSSGPKKKVYGAPPSAADLQSSILSTTTNGGRSKKRKGALTNPSAYSMTSSSLVRTEQLGILDARFDKIEEEYADPDFDDAASRVSGASGVSGMTGMSAASSVTGPVRGDFDSVLDEFLGNHKVVGKKHIRKGPWKNGLDQLDEIRRDLGPARLSRGKTKPGAAGAKKTAVAGAAR